MNGPNTGGDHVNVVHATDDTSDISADVDVDPTLPRDDVVSTEEMDSARVVHVGRVDGMRMCVGVEGARPCVGVDACGLSGTCMGVSCSACTIVRISSSHAC